MSVSSRLIRILGTHLKKKKTKQATHKKRPDRKGQQTPSLPLFHDLGKSLPQRLVSSFAQGVQVTG